jgi:hypothetical protein
MRSLITIILTLILQDLGEYSSFLDTIAPEQLIEIKDNTDGTYTAIYMED